MRTQKLSPRDRKNIVARAKSGERQKDLASEYGVSEALISRVIKQSKESKPDTLAPRQIDLSDKTADQLRNRYRQIHMELLRHNSEIQQRLAEADGLQHSIEVESKKDDGVRDEGWILAQKKRHTWCLDTSHTAYEMARLYQEASAILQVFAKKGIPIGPSVLNGIIPAAKAK